MKTALVKHARAGLGCAFSFTAPLAEFDQFHQDRIGEGWG